MTFDIKGVKYEFCFSFFALLCLAFLITEGSTSTLCIISSLLHEAGHIIPLYVFKCPPHKIVLGAFGIRIEKRDCIKLSYKKEAVVSIGGIVVNIALFFIGLLFRIISGSEEAFVFMFVNIFIAVFNSIPVSVLDLGRFLRYILLVYYDEEKVNRIMNKISDISVISVVTAMLLYTGFFGINISLIAVSLYLIILNFRKDGKQK